MRATTDQGDLGGAEDGRGAGMPRLPDGHIEADDYCEIVRQVLPGNLFSRPRWKLPWFGMIVRGWVDEAYTTTAKPCFFAGDKLQLGVVDSSEHITINDCPVKVLDNFEKLPVHRHLEARGWPPYWY
ncbi:hypothetical protein SUNI508_12456 [Seiridium unicorne]|uniref:Uncharacterized protein n=1 Tax=Seiridium unicorne TaxID=138068 RepID=A0ABR2UE11_9PEZI